MLARRARLALATAVLLVGFMPGQTERSAAQVQAGEESEIEIVVTGMRDIVVNGRAIRCRPRQGDPLDDVRVGGGWGDYMMIVPDERGGYAAKRTTEQITGPDFWQRVGMGMGAYRFRGESDGKPMCVGGRGGADSFGGFRRIVDAAPYRGHRVRFTAWVATGRAGQVSFWLATQFNGGNTNNVPFHGDHRWTPVLLETGPIHRSAAHISYGFNLQGSGDVWVYEPKLEIVTDEAAGTEDVILIGRGLR